MIPASVSLPVMQAGCAKTAEQIDVLFEVETPGDPIHIILDGGPYPLLQVGDAVFAKLLWTLCFLLHTDIVYPPIYGYRSTYKPRLTQSNLQTNMLPLSHTNCQ